MDTIKKTEKTKKIFRISKNIILQENPAYESIQNRIYLRMEDLNLDIEKIPPVVKSRMNFTRNGNEYTAVFKKECFGMGGSLYASDLYLICLFLKTEPILFSNMKIKEYLKLKPDSQFIPMTEEMLNDVCNKYMQIEDVARRLRKVRREKDIVVAEMAEILKVSPASIVNYEKGKRKKLRLTARQLFRLSERLDVSPDMIMLGESFDSVLERTEKGIDSEHNTDSEKNNAEPAISTADQSIREKKRKSIPIRDIIRCREWIIDNIDMVDQDVLIMIYDIINRAMHQTPVIIPDDDGDDEIK